VPFGVDIDGDPQAPFFVEACNPDALRGADLPVDATDAPGAGRVDVGALGSGHPPGEPDSAGREALSPAAGVPLVSMRPLTTPFSLGEASRVGHVGEHLVRPPVHLCGRCRHFGPPRSNGAARPPRYMGEPWGPSTPSQPHTILRRGGLPELGEVTTPGSFVSKPQV